MIKLKKILTESDDKAKLVQQLVSGGSNKQDAIKQVDNHYDYICRVYPDASIKQKAKIIRSIHENKSVLKEELYKFPGSAEIKKLLNGFEQYSHGPNEIGFVNYDPAKSAISVTELDTLLKKYYVARRKGDNVMGYYTWGYEKSGGPYHTYFVSFNSKDGKVVRNFSAKLTRED